MLPCICFWVHSTNSTKSAAAESDTYIGWLGFVLKLRSMRGEGRFSHILKSKKKKKKEFYVSHVFLKFNWKGKLLFLTWWYYSEAALLAGEANVLPERKVSETCVICPAQIASCLHSDSWKVTLHLWATDSTSWNIFLPLSCSACFALVIPTWLRIFCIFNRKKLKDLWSAGAVLNRKRSRLPIVGFLGGLRELYRFWLNFSTVEPY